MTFLEVLENEYPEYVGRDRWHGGAKGCPSSYGYEDSSFCPSARGRLLNCSECWRREAPLSITENQDLDWEAAPLDTLMRMEDGA